MPKQTQKLHQLKPAQLQQEVVKLSQQIALTRMKIKTQSEKNVRLLKTLRHQLARVKTIMTQKQLSS